MNAIRRGLLYCIRQRTRMLVLIIVLTVVATLALGSLAVRDAGSRSASDVQVALGAKIILETDTDGNMGATSQSEWGTTYTYTGDQITPDVISAVEGVEGVAGYNVEEESAYYGAGVNFKYLPAAFDISFTPYGQTASYTATASSEECSKFQSGAYRLIEGRHLNPDDLYSCLISKELADYNGLKVGDTAQMYSLDTDEVTPFEIVGIFDGTEGSSGNAQMVDEIPANNGFISSKAVFEMLGDLIDGYDQVTIFVSDPSQTQVVLDRIAALPELKGKTLKLRTDTTGVSAVSSPLESLDSVMGWTVLLTFVAGAAVTAVLLAIWVKGRSREVGILLSLGKSKASIVAQFFVEVLVVALIAVILSIGACVLAMGAGGGAAMAWLIPEVKGADLQVGALSILWLSIGMILLVLVAVALSSWRLVRAKPNDVLTNIG